MEAGGKKVPCRTTEGRSEKHGTDHVSRGQPGEAWEIEGSRQWCCLSVERLGKREQLGQAKDARRIKIPVILDLQRFVQ